MTRAGLATLLLLVAGCSSGEATIPVEGKVLVDGQPLTFGTVIFTPDASKGNASPHEPRGKIDTQGTYRLMQTKDRPGAPPGWYKISISAQKLTDPKDAYSYQSVLPPKFANPDTSGLSLQISDKPAPGAYDITISTKP